MEKSFVTDLTEGNVPKQLMSYAAPFIFASILQSVYGLVDLVVVGQFVGSTGLSAVGISGQVMFLLTAMAIGFSSGGQIVISQLVGSKNLKRLNVTIGTLFSLLGILAIILTILGIIFCPSILSLLNTPEEAYAQAKSYLLICSIGMIFIYGYNGVCATLRGMGESKLPLYFVAIASVVNIVLDLLFVGGFKMQSAGAALATVLGQAVAFICSVIYLYKKRENFGFDFKLSSFKMEEKTAKVIIKLGLPMALQQMLINISMLYVNSCVNQCGLVASAVDSVGGKINGLMGVVCSSMNSAGAAMVAQNIGAGKKDRVVKIFWTSEGICMCFLALIIVLFMGCPTQIFRIFNQEPAVLAMAPTYLRIAIIFYATFATMAAPLSIINGVGNAGLNLGLAILDGFVVRISLTVLLGYTLGMGLEGFWLGNALAGFTTTIIGGIYFLSGRWKKRELLLHKETTDTICE